MRYTVNFVHPCVVDDANIFNWFDLMAKRSEAKQRNRFGNGIEYIKMFNGAAYLRHVIKLTAYIFYPFFSLLQII